MQQLLCIEFQARFKIFFQNTPDMGNKRSIV
uniref:Uncharacterized protein n=1 Tax=Anguilla anguilla TaxID=7936 RepID=A0A0E9WCM4_ANGAN